MARAATLIVLLTLSVLLSGAAPTEATNSRPINQVEDKIGDLMKNLPRSFEIIVHFDHHPSAKEAAELEVLVS